MTNPAAIRELRQTQLELLGWRFAASPPMFAGNVWIFSVWHIDHPSEAMRNFRSVARWRALTSALDFATMEEGRAEQETRDTERAPAMVAE